MKKLLFTCLMLTAHLPMFAQGMPDQSTLKAHAPLTFQAVFRTTRGDFTIEVYRAWSPAGADRLFQLLSTGFYNQNALFRVQKEYVIQFGISDNPAVNTFWDRKPIPDEAVAVSNLRGTISYARDGMNSRTAQLFINLNDNYKLDTVNFNGLRGFPPVAKIIRGFETVESFYGGYGFEPASHQDSVMIHGNRYLKNKFPELDYIIEVTILHEP
jgi:cyclophilin family peptidyl-prolyl cis-trans isomerase